MVCLTTFGGLNMFDFLVEGDIESDPVRNRQDLIAVRKTDVAFVLLPDLLPAGLDYRDLSCRKHVFDFLSAGLSGLRGYRVSELKALSDAMLDIRINS